MGSRFDSYRPYLLMILLQFGAAGNYILSKISLNSGMNRYVLIVYRNAIAALILAPFAILLERRRRKIRPELTRSVLLQIMALGFLEPILDQGFTYLGMNYTSASFTSAIMNAVPSVTFVIAFMARIERVNIKELRSQAKVIGTLITLGGAFLMAMYKGPVINMEWVPSHHLHHAAVESAAASDGSHWLVGTLLILLGCIAWSCFYVLQSITIKKYPAEMSLSSLICLAGTFQSLVIALFIERNPRGWAVGWDTRLFTPVYTGIVASGITYWVQGIVMKNRGPVFVTAFNPLCMIIVTLLSVSILGETLNLGSILGGILIAIGLYSVVWGKSRDYFGSEDLPVSTDEKSTIQDVSTTQNEAVTYLNNNNNKGDNS